MTAETCWQICGLSGFAGLLLTGNRCDFGALSCHVVRLPESVVAALAWRGPGPVQWTWAGEQRAVTGPTWGGCPDILDIHLRTGRYLLAPEAYAGCVLIR